MSPDILTIQDCMAKVMGDVREVAKKDRNTQQNFPFRGVDRVVNAVAPALRKQGVVVLPRLEEIEREHVLSGAKQTPMLAVHVIVTYRFVGPGGDWLEAKVAGEAMDSGDKATAKAMSVAFRIALLQALALPTDDIDPDATSYQGVAPASAAPGESTAEPHTGQGSVTSARDGKGAQAADVPLTTSGSLQGAPAASPSLSVVDPGGEITDTAAPEKAEIAYGEGATPISGAASTYLSKEEQRHLIIDYGSNKAAVEAYQKRFGERIKRLADITCEMVELMDG